MREFLVAHFQISISLLEKTGLQASLRPPSACVIRLFSWTPRFDLPDLELVAPAALHQLGPEQILEALLLAALDETLVEVGPHLRVLQLLSGPDAADGAAFGFGSGKKSWMGFAV